MWNPLVLMVDNIKSEVGIDVEDGGDIKKPANNKLDPTAHSKPTFPYKQDPSFSSFVGHLIK
jgi:hypothetical protein